MANEEYNEEEARRIAEQHREALKISLAEVQAQDRQDKTDALKSLRVTINTAIADAKSVADTLIQRGPGGRELSLCITNLQQARMWAGEALGELGHKLPAEYRDEAKPRQTVSDPVVISAEIALQRYGAEGVQKLLSDGFLESVTMCTDEGWQRLGFRLSPAIPSEEAR